jgi:hypothetical protein
MSKFDPRRIGKITASQVYLLFPRRDNKVSQLSYAKHLANEMYFGEIKEVSTWQTEHGENAEHHAHNHYTQHYDFGAILKPQFYEKGQFGGTPDAIADTYGIDYKCPTSFEKWLEYLYEGIDYQQQHQAQMYMWLSGLKLWKVCIYLTETEKMYKDELSYPIEEEKRMIIINVNYDENWANDLYENIERVA